MIASPPTKSTTFNLLTSFEICGSWLHATGTRECVNEIEHDLIFGQLSNLVNLLFGEANVTSCCQQTIFYLLHDISTFPDCPLIGLPGAAHRLKIKDKYLRSLCQLLQEITWKWIYLRRVTHQTYTVIAI